MEANSSLIAALDRRIGECMAVPVQLSEGGHERLVDPLRGGEVLLNPRRAQRPLGGDRGCPFCTGQTPPTLFYVEADAGEGEDPGVGPAQIETEQDSFRAIRRYLAELPEGAGPDPWAVIRLLMDVRHPDRTGRDVPIVHPAEPWLVRTFLNFVPLIREPATGANCFVLSVPPPFHDRDIGILKHNPAGDQPPLPLVIMEALLESWVVLETWAKHRDLIPIPFINGGKNPLSGQSLECFHSQFFALSRADFPPLYGRFAERRREGDCPVDRILERRELVVARFGEYVVCVHPAPVRNYSLVVAPEREVADLASLEDRRRFAAALSWAIRAYEILLGGVPAYVVALRTGDSVGHLHAEVVPRSLVNVPGGFEETTGFVVTTKDPREVAERLRREHAVRTDEGR
ncbi:MAG: hypothetical protein Kow00129_00820 [Thermoleophilia bacterium]